MKQEQVVSLHAAIAGAMGMTVDEEGRLFGSTSDGTPPIVNAAHEGRQYILPTHEFLASGNRDYLPFYLLGESITSNESSVLQKARSMITYRLMCVINELISHFFNLKMSGNDEAIPAKQKEVLKYIKDIDETTVSAFGLIVEGLSVKGHKMLVKFFQKFQGSVEGVKYSRTCHVSFPIIEALENAESTNNKVFDVTLRAKDIKALKAVFYYLLGDEANDSETPYSRGSNDLTAPYFHSLALSFVAVAEVLNVKLKRYGLETINLDWAGELESLSKYRGIIPNGLEGTDGTFVNKALKTPKVGMANEAFSGGTTNRQVEEVVNQSPTIPVQQQAANVIQNTAAAAPTTSYGNTYVPKVYNAHPQGAVIINGAQHYNQVPVVVQPSPMQPAGAQPQAKPGAVTYEQARAQKNARIQQQEAARQGHFYQQPQQMIYQAPVVQTNVQPQLVYIGNDPATGQPLYQQVQQPATQQQQMVMVKDNYGNVSYQPVPVQQQLAVNVDPNHYFNSFNQPAQPTTSYYAPQQPNNYYGSYSTAPQPQQNYYGAVAPSNSTLGTHYR